MLFERLCNTVHQIDPIDFSSSFPNYEEDVHIVELLSLRKVSTQLLRKYQDLR